MSTVPPQNLEAESAVLGGILLDNMTIHDLPPELKSDSFYLSTHGRIFQAMLALSEREAPIDVVSVTDEAKKAGHTIQVSTLIEFQDHGMPRSVAYHANLIIQACRRRQAINLVREALRSLEESPEDHDQILTNLSSSLNAPQPGNARTVPISTVVTETLQYIETLQAGRVLIPTGFTDLDYKIGGMERGELMVVGGRPSMGKTSFAVDIALNAAERGYKVHLVSVETTRTKLGARMLARETKINSRRFRKGILTQDEIDRVVHASATLSALPIHMTDLETGWLNIKREIHKRKRDGLDLVILDYLTLLDISYPKGERRDVAVGRIANEAKRLALSLDIVFVLLSQLNRKNEDRAKPEPTMADLRDSGEIEQAADIVIFPFRPVVYDEKYETPDKGFLKIGKGRDLPTGKIPVRFNAEITSFSDWSEF